MVEDGESEAGRRGGQADTRAGEGCRNVQVDGGTASVRIPVEVGKGRGGDIDIGGDGARERVIRRVQQSERGEGGKGR